MESIVGGALQHPEILFSFSVLFLLIFFFFWKKFHNSLTIISIPKCNDTVQRKSSTDGRIDVIIAGASITGSALTYTLRKGLAQTFNELKRLKQMGDTLHMKHNFLESLVTAFQRGMHIDVELVSTDGLINHAHRVVMVGERVVQLLGGKKQRIEIARAMLKNLSILLLNEATSTLDAEFEKLVQEALDSFMIGRTIMVIAQRLPTIRNAYLVAVVEEGQILEIGLLAQGNP